MTLEVALSGRPGGAGLCFLLCALAGGCSETQPRQDEVPIASVGSDQTVLAGAEVELAGSGHLLSGADTVSLQWSLIGKPLGSAAQLTDATSEHPKLVTDVAGRYLVELVALNGTASSPPETTDVFAKGPPNVLVILADDVGFGDVGPYQLESSQVPTPNLDRLAAEGMVFTDAHAPASVCAPTRYTALTGNYPFRGRLGGGVWSSYADSMLLPGQATVGEVMRAAGYETAFVGKWQQGGKFRLQGSDDFFELGGSVTDIDFTRPFESGPLDHGFDFSLVLPSGIQAQPFAYFANDTFEPIDGLTSVPIVLTAGPFNGGMLPQGGMGDANWDSRQVGPRLLQRALDFIDEHHRRNEETNSDQPFFMLYTASAIHKPWTPPDLLGEVPVAGATGLGEKADMIFELDLQVGALLQAIEDRKLTSDTLIFFTSDNGGIETGSPSGHDSVAGLRGFKGGIYEGGHRVPFIAKWGDGTESGSVIAPGSTCDELIALHDYVATLYDLTGQALPAEQARDSANLLPVLLGEESGTPVRDFLLTQSSNSTLLVDRRGIRRGNWSLLYDALGNSVELYDLATDLEQTTNLIGNPAHADLVTELEALMQFALSGSERTTPTF